MRKLTILGKSDATITMILDNLESNKEFYNIEIVNNLNSPIINEYDNPNFNIEFSDNLYDYENLVLGVFRPNIKNRILSTFNIDEKKLLNIIHSSSQISSTTILGKACLINSLVSIAAHSKIGSFVSINRNSSIGHHTIISDFVTINPGVNIAGNVVIGKNTLIGMGTNVFDGIKIGENCVIGAGSLVTKDIPDNVVAYGNPCKIIRKNET